MISTVGENSLIAFVNKVFENLAVMDLGRGGFRFVDEFAFGIHFGVVLVAIVSLVVLFGPTCIAVFLTTFRGGRVELVRTLAVFDFLVLLAGVSLAWSVDKTGINDAAFFGDEALAGERPVEGLLSSNPSYRSR